MKARPRAPRPPALLAAPLLAALISAAATAASPPAAAPGQGALPLSDAHRDWLEREVAYIISSRERDAFQNLQSEAERAAFIAAFWERRDPEPLTPENEFRTEHYERIEYANSRLGGESAVPGWMTDRGRIHIQLGEPDDREIFPSAPGMYPAELWFYLQRDEYLLPPLYVLFFREHNAGPYQLFNHLIHDPEDLLPAQSYGDDSRAEAYELLTELSPQLAHATITMRADRGTTVGLALSDIAMLDTQTILADINRAPYRRLDTAWAAEADSGRGLVETEYLFGFVPSAGAARVFPGPPSAPDTWFVHYALEIEAQHFTLAREEGGAEYFTRFELQGEVTDEGGRAVHHFAASPFLRLTESELQNVGARPFAYRGMFPLVEGEYRLRVILKNQARNEYTLFEEAVVIPAQPDGPRLGNPLLVHSRVAPDGEGEAYRTWTPAGTPLVPNARAAAAVGSPVEVIVPAVGAGAVTLRVAPWDPAAEETGAPAPQPVHEAEAVASDRHPYARAVLDTAGWSSGRYLISAASAGAEVRTIPFELSARRSIAVPWGLSDSFDPEAPGAIAATLGDQWLRLDDRERARPLFEAALRDDPNSTRARLVLGRLALDDEEPREAVRLLEPALAQNPERADILRVLGDAHRESGNPARAADLYERSLAVVAADATLLNALGWSLAASGQPARAVEPLERSLELDPDQPEVREMLATVRARAASPGQFPPPRP